MDIAERKEIEHELLASESKYRGLVEITDDWVWSVNHEGIHTFTNQAVQNLLGYKVDEVVGSSAFPLMHPDDEKRSKEMLEQCIAQKTGWQNIPIRWLHKDKSERYFESSASPILDVNGKVIGFSGIDRNITERKHAVAELIKREARSRRQREALAKLAIDESLLKTDLKEGFDKIAEILSTTIEVEFASIWLFSDDEKTLDCISLNKSGENIDTGGLKIVTESIPEYFHAIRTESRIFASDVQNDPRVAELLQKCLIPQGITSMLDAGILIKGKLAGVVCLEHTGKKRNWEADEEAFVSTVAAIVAQALINSERRKTKELLRESEQKFREVFNSTNEAIFIGEALSGLMIDCNQRAIEMYGFDNKEEILNGTIGDISANSEQYNQLMAKHKGRVTVEEGTQTFEWLAKKKNGELFWVEVSLKNTKIGGEKRVLAVVRDISQRKLAENELLESEKKFRHYFENSSIGKSITSPDGSIQVNQALCQMLGYSKEELESKKWQEVTYADDIGLTYQQIDLLRTKKEKNVRFEKRYLHKNGTIIFAEVNSFLQFDKEGVELNYFTNINNITVQKQALESLRVSDERNKLLSEVTLEGILIHRKGVAKDLNKSLAKIFGYEREELLNRNFFEFVHPDDIAIAQEHIVKDYAHPYEVRALKKDGQVFFIEIESKNFHYHDEEWRVTSIRDITERKQQQKEYKQLIDAMNDTAFVINFDGKFVHLNKAAVEVLGYSMDELLNMGVWDIDPHLGSGEIYGLINSIKTDIRQVFETEHQAKTGKIIPVEISSSLLNYQGKEAILSVARDITRRKQAEQEILQAKESAERSEEKFRNYIQSSPTSVFLTDKNGKYTFVNNSACKLLGYTIEEMLQFSITDITNASSNEDALKSFEELRKSGETHNVEKQLIRKDGRVIDVVLDGKKLSENENIAFVKDISDRKIAEKMLKDQNEEYAILNQQYVQINYQLTHTNAQLQLAKEISEENELKFRLMYENTSIGIAVISLEFKIHAANKAYCKMLGYTENELIGKSLQQITHPETVEENIRLQTELLHGLIPSFQLEKAFLHKAGHTVFGLLTATLIKNSKNEPLYFLGNVQDITEIKKATEQVRLSEEKFRKSFYTNPDAIIINRLDNGIGVMINKGFKQITGYTDEEIIGVDPSFINIWADRNDRKKLYELLLTQGYAENLEAKFIIKNGSIIHGLVSASMIDLEGVPHIISITRDITKLKQAEMELIKAKEKAEESDRLKSAFLANMSHEIRTPMNGILGFAELLKEPDLSGEDQHRFLGIIEKSGERMLNIINDLINISKIEAGQMDITLAETNINDQIEFIYTFFKPEVAKKGIALSYVCALPKKDSTIITDREKMYAILTNLVKNAIKYTNEGSIEFGYKTIETQGLASLQFYVKDTGIGIPKERQEAIFDRFVQADIEDRDAMQGAGLGLAITKAYVEMLGGKIWVESQEENLNEGLSGGSVFYFTIPLAPFKEQSEQKESEAVANESSDHPLYNLPKLKILIAEDDQISDEVLSFTLEDFSSQILHVTTGTEAVEACRQHPDIDLVLMDLKMPLMNGLEATRIIRTFNKKVIIIAQTAYALAGDREKALEAGCNDYLAKPIKKEVLMGLIKKHFKA